MTTETTIDQPPDSAEPTAAVDFPRLLVLTGCPPGNDGVGAILERQILEEVPRELLRVVTLTPRGIDPQRVDGNEWVDANLTRRYEHAYRPIKGFPGELSGWIAHQVMCQPHLRHLIRESVQHGTEHRCEAVLAVLESPSVIFIAEQVARQLDVPLYCFVMDGPHLHAHDYGYDGLLKRRLLDAFDSCMRYASRIATAGESMQKAYCHRYGTEASILRQGVHYTPVNSLPAVPDEAGPVRIGFAGSLTARDAFSELIRDLDRRSWKLAGRDVIVRIVGSHVRLKPSGPQHIEYFGWRLVPDMLRLTQECQFLYMPQPFSGHLQEFAELSFPNKLCTYVPARRPIMFPAPKNASLLNFFDRFRCGPVSTDISATALLNQTEQAISSPEVYRDFQQRVETAFREELNEQRLRTQVRSFLGCRVSAAS